ncbi:MAG: hypothetical protein V4723_11605 [Pseudomonadota bacterium]
MNKYLATLFLAGALAPAYAAEQSERSPVSIRGSNGPCTKVMVNSGNAPAHQLSAMQMGQGERRLMSSSRSEKLLPELEWITPLRHWLV